MFNPNLKPYPTYKPSGVEWLGDVPAHWEVRRLKQICRMEYGDSLTTEVRRIGSVPVFGSNGCVGSHEVANTEAPCVIVGRKGSFGKVHYSSTRVFAIDTTFLIDKRFSSMNIRWLYYMLGWLHLDEVNNDSAVPGLAREEAYRRLVSVPPLPEQTAIVRFLNHADQRIQRYIRAKQKLIALLEEQKQVIVHEAVTGRIDVRTGKPYPTYKNSGVEWLGEVPTHWEVRRLKSWLDVNELVLSEDTDAEYTFDYLDIGAVETGRLAAMPERIRFADSPSRARRVVRAGDTLVSTVRTYLKAVWWYAGQPHGGLIASTGFAVLTPRRDTYPKFVNYVCQSDSFTNRVTADSVGIAYPAIAETRLGTFKICVPPLSEQTAIVEFLDKATAAIDTSISCTRRQIEVLQEYRTRLIADVVTGKLDVREAAAELPETDTIDDFGESETAQAESNASSPNNALRKEDSP